MRLCRWRTENEPREFMNFTVFDISDPAVIQSYIDRRNEEREDAQPSSSGAKSLLEILLDQKVFLPKTVSQQSEQAFVRPRPNLSRP